MNVNIGRLHIYARREERLTWLSGRLFCTRRATILRRRDACGVGFTGMGVFVGFYWRHR